MFGGIIVVDEFDAPIPFVPDKTRQIAKYLIYGVIGGKSPFRVGLNVAPLRQRRKPIFQVGNLFDLLIQCPLVCGSGLRGNIFRLADVAPIAANPIPHCIVELIPHIPPEQIGLRVVLGLVEAWSGLDAAECARIGDIHQPCELRAFSLGDDPFRTDIPKVVRSSIVNCSIRGG